VPETRGARACRKRALRLAVAFVVLVVEADRTPEHDGVERASGLRPRPLAYRPQKERDDVGVAEGAAADGRRLVDEAAAEQALQRAHQPSRACRRDTPQRRCARRARAARLPAQRTRRSARTAIRPRDRRGAPIRRRAATGRS
jgi:hypothetical protein